MSGKYKHIPEEISVVVSKLRSLMQDYDEEINQLNQLVSIIETSSDWKDAQVKTSFVSTASAYIASYNGLITMMERYINYLENKNNSGSALEKAYS